MEVKNIEQLNQEFSQGKLKELPETITVDTVEYYLTRSTEYPLHESLNDAAKKPMVIYKVRQNNKNIERFKAHHTSSEDETTFQSHILLIWGAVGLVLRPAAVRFVSEARISQAMVREAKIDDDRIIKNKVGIVLNGFNGNDVIPAKVDTGAEMSSIDANNIDINKSQNVVSFSFGDRRVTMPLVTRQAVKTADGGMEYRPVVEFDVMIPNTDAEKKNRVLKKVAFNLNDRSGMPDKILLGQNFIKKGDFVVMSKGEESKMIESTDEINWDILQKEYTDLVAEEVGS